MRHPALTPRLAAPLLPRPAALGPHHQAPEVTHLHTHLEDQPQHPLAVYDSDLHSVFLIFRWRIFVIIQWRLLIFRGSVNLRWWWGLSICRQWCCSVSGRCTGEGTADQPAWPSVMSHVKAALKAICVQHSHSCLTAWRKAAFMQALELEHLQQRHGQASYTANSQPTSRLCQDDTGQVASHIHGNLPLHQADSGLHTRIVSSCRQLVLW